MQWIGSLGVARIVHTGYVLGASFIKQSKQAVTSWPGGGRALAASLIVQALVTHLAHRLDLTQIALRARLDERHAGRAAQLVDMPSCVQIVERTHHQIKLTDPLDVILRLFDVAMTRVNVDVAGRIEMMRGRGGHERFGFLDVGLAKEKLPVQVGEVDRVEVDLRECPPARNSVDDTHQGVACSQSQYSRIPPGRGS